MTPELRFSRWLAAALLLLAWIFTSCRTIPPLPPVNLSEQGWTLHQGQALWRTKRDAPEIAGEVLFATHPRGDTLLQLTKNPLPFVTVQTSGESWQIEFVPQRRRFSGKGKPSARLAWVHLARALSGATPDASWKFTR